MGSPVFGAYRWLPDRQWVLVAELHRDQVMAAVKEYEKSAVMASAAVIFLGFIPIGVVFAISITGPITKLRKMVKIISQGNWHQRVQVESFQEIAALAETFNQMADKIKKSELEIQVKQLELQEKNRLLEKLATTDPLTYVYNRRFILERLPNEMAQASRYGEQLSTIMLDLDHFKRVNDTYGHSIGDQALLGVVEAINLTIRKADIMGRWGGEEFIIICPNTGKAAAAALAERIRQRVEEVDFVTNEGAQISLSVSIGVAEFYPKTSESKLNSDDMIIRADKALYQAKNSGRNKVVVDME
jgi:diguanylate cyclase (GGDEF)-like protein